MRTRLFIPTALLIALSSPAWANAQGKPAAAPAAPAAPAAAQAAPDATVAPAPDAATDVSVKDTSASPPSKTAGHDTLSVDFPETDIRDVLRNVAELFDLNIVIPDQLQGKTSVKLHDVTWHQIFQVVLSPVGYTFIEDGNIIKIVSNESLTQEPVSTEIFVINYAKAADIAPTLASLVEASAGGKIVIDARTNSLVVTERPSRMKRIRPVIDQLDRATDQVMIESKFVEITNGDIRNLGVNWSSLSSYSVTATPGSNGIYNYTNQYGTATSNGVSNTGQNQNSTNGNNSTNLNNGANNSNTNTSTNGTVTNTATTGTTSSIATAAGTTVSTLVSQAQNLTNNITATGTSSNTLAAVFSADQFKLVLAALQQTSAAKIVSNPTIVTLNNTEASINVGQQYPIPSYTFNQQTGTFEVSGFNYKDIGIILKVTPQVNSRGFIKLTLSPEVSQNQGTTSFGGASGASIPIIGSRKVTTQVSLKDGYTMGIGGLISDNLTTGTNAVPILGSIPIIGYLFKQDNKNDQLDNLVIFITAKTISAEGAPVEQIFNSSDVRSFQLKRSDLPGYRDGTDPFVDETPTGKRSQ